MPARLFKTLLLLLIALSLKAQQDTSWRVLLHQKNKLIIQHSNMMRYRKTGFLLGRNVVYRVTMTDNKMYEVKVLDVKPDSLLLLRLKEVYTYGEPDTLWVHYNQLKVLHLPDNAFSLGNHQLANFNFVFERDTMPYFPSKWEKRRIYDSTVQMEVSPQLTEKGIVTQYTIDTVYRRHNYPIPVEDTIMAGRDTIYRKRNWVGFTPSGREEINGLSFGFYNKNTKNRRFRSSRFHDSLVTRGMVVELNPIFIMSPIFLIYMPAINKGETYEQYLQTGKPKWETKAYGLIVSLMNVGDAELYGLNIAGAALVNEIHGLSVAGLYSVAYLQKGVSISFINKTLRSRGFQLGVFNSSFDHRGFQLGLLNHSFDDHRGLQIGLWNVNAKRKLPFINWQTKAKKVTSAAPSVSSPE